jgi:hypothetical protein
MVRTDLEKLLAAIPATGSGQQNTTVGLLDAAGLVTAANVPGQANGSNVPGAAGLVTATNSSGQANGGTVLGDEMGRLAAQLEQLRQVTATQVDSLNQNTDAVIQSASSKSSGPAAQIASGAGKVVSSILGGSGLGALVSGIIGLFGGGSQDPPAPLTHFSLPQAVKVDAGLAPGGQFAPVNYSQDGLPRTSAAPAPVQQINVQVNAMDSQSFLDRSDDIARAVKEAMLNSHSINDVVADL